MEIILNPLCFPVSLKLILENGFSTPFYCICRCEGLDTAKGIVKSLWWYSFVIIITEFSKFAFGPALSPGNLRQELGQNSGQYVESLDTVQRGGCTFPVAKEQRKQVWGQQVGKNTLETWLWILAQVIVNIRILICHRHSLNLNFLSCEMRRIILPKAVGEETRNKLEKYTNVR